MAQDQVKAEQAERKAYRAETLDIAQTGVSQVYVITLFLAKVLRPASLGGEPLFSECDLEGLGHILEYCGEKLLPAMEALSEARMDVPHA